MGKVWIKIITKHSKTERGFSCQWLKVTHLNITVDLNARSEERWGGLFVVILFLTHSSFALNQLCFLVKEIVVRLEV